MYDAAMRPAQGQSGWFGISAQRIPVVSPSNSLMFLQGKLGQVDSAESGPSTRAERAAQVKELARAGFRRDHK